GRVHGGAVHDLPQRHAAHLPPDLQHARLRERHARQVLRLHQERRPEVRPAPDDGVPRGPRAGEGRGGGGVSTRSSRLRLAVALLAAALLLTACGRNLADQPKVEPFEASPFFADGAGMRVPPANTVSREFGALDPAYLTGQGEGGMLADLPVPLTVELLQRGKVRYDIY